MLITGTVIKSGCSVDKSEEHKPDEKETGSSAGKILNIAAYPIAAASGFMVGKTHIYQESYGTHDRKGAFDTIKKEFMAEYNNILDNKNLTPNEKKLAFYRNRSDFNQARTAKLEEMGFKNTWDHYRYSIASHARNNALISGFTIAGIALGVMLMVSNSKNIFGSLYDKDDKDNGVSK
jgi:hypothetical protein